MPDLNDQRDVSRSIIVWSNLIAVPWRNGGGVTRQILSRRLEGSDNWVPAADDWNWRLSIADVASAGAFSSFTGMTRVLTVIEGTSVTLTVGATEVTLERFDTVLGNATHPSMISGEGILALIAVSACA